MKNKLKWYNYAAKVILIAISSPIFPILAVIGMATGGGPFDLYKDIWNSEYERT